MNTKLFLKTFLFAGLQMYKRNELWQKKNKSFKFLIKFSFKIFKHI